MNKVTIANRKGKMRRSSHVIPILDKEARLAALRQIRGMWKNRKPDPIKELAKMRREWERKLP